MSLCEENREFLLNPLVALGYWQQDADSFLRNTSGGPNRQVLCVKGTEAVLLHESLVKNRGPATQIYLTALVKVGGLLEYVQRERNSVEKFLDCVRHDEAALPYMWLRNERARGTLAAYLTNTTASDLRSDFYALFGTVWEVISGKGGFFQRRTNHYSLFVFPHRDSREALLFLGEKKVYF
ncbi:MAG: hypothetical protein H6500_00725 [Candidatus Woesearchaeota archaeon]|nr:hypothetical protein [Nanoarchaeota archaeon]USN44356.1 MAG: hypothetical protein H6500_00725 [Candidatus Woesearchaeota archaeon]